MRRLSQQQVLAMVLNTWHRGSPAQHFGSSVVGTAWFLWVVVLVALLMGALAGFVALVGKSEEHCKHGAGPFARIECTQGSKAQRAGELDEVRHTATVPAAPEQEYVHEATP